MNKPPLKRLATIARLKAKAKAGILSKAELAQLEHALSCEAFRAQRERWASERRSERQATRARAMERDRPYCQIPDNCQVKSRLATHCRGCEGARKAALGISGRRYEKRPLADLTREE